jgi:hypothetical protein
LLRSGARTYEGYTVISGVSSAQGETCNDIIGGSGYTRTTTDLCRLNGQPVGVGESCCAFDRETASPDLVARPGYYFDYVIISSGAFETSGPFADAQDCNDFVDKNASEIEIQTDCQFYKDNPG